jgi:hypothetical protein
MVEKRVIELKDKNPNEMTPFLLKTMNEFIDMFAARTGKLEPYDIDVVYERQPRPSQRQILQRAEHGVANNTTSVFQKAEAYGKITDPRAISQINGVDKRDYSCFMYALSDAVKVFDWYAFGKNPKQIAERVAYICENSESHVDGTDFSRMDGRVSPLARYLERMLMLRLFPAKYHVTLLSLLKSQTGLSAITKFGVCYNTGTARASGSPETSVFNTVLNAFIAFLTSRMTRVGGRYMDKHEAWQLLGIYGGDDGLSSDTDGKAAEKAARLMGQVMTVERVKRGDLGVSFLARHYGPDVWWGDSNSCCDIKRQITKFHLTTKLSSKVTPLIKLREKSFALSLSDSNTPVLGWFAKRVLELMPMQRNEYNNHLRIWNADIDQENHYPNVYAEWMMDLFMSQLPDFDIDGFIQWVHYANIDQLLKAPVFMEPPEPVVKDGLVEVDGDFVGTPPSASPEAEKPPTVPSPETAKPARKFRGRKPSAKKKTASSKSNKGKSAVAEKRKVKS